MFTKLLNDFRGNSWKALQINFWLLPKNTFWMYFLKNLRAFAENDTRTNSWQKKSDQFLEDFLSSKLLVIPTGTTGSIFGEIRGKIPGRNPARIPKEIWKKNRKVYWKKISEELFETYWEKLRYFSKELQGGIAKQL